ncbi:methyltransferase domain-containing protein [Catenuloplanes japonicus]|uniref:methyltransferase domain-containing protein n=1 Tax=Catenuloplanes japonicus TaxID=33876 RepID=UPI00068A63A4|nr:methyltransferase domain-containing protein [Catenuloplanes japonicus]
MTSIADYSGTEQTPHMREYLAAAAGSSGIAQVRATALSMWDVKPDGFLIDVGCGHGEVARELSRLMPGADVTALDHSADMIATAGGLDDGTSVKYLVGDVYDLPYTDELFDGVRSERVLQHLADPDRAVGEMARVLVPGGRLCLIDTDWDSLLLDGSPAGFHERGLAFFQEFQRMSKPIDAPTSGRTLRRRLITAGLRDVRTEPVTLLFTSVAAIQPIMPLNRQMFQAIGFADRAASWLDDLDRADADDTFLATLTIWVATGTR